jgi:hypothetical protein
MFQQDPIELYSEPIEQQMLKIGNLMREFAIEFGAKELDFSDKRFEKEMHKAFISVAGKGYGTNADVFRDLQKDISTLSAFLVKYQKIKDLPEYAYVLKFTEIHLQELQKLEKLVNETPNDIMDEIKRRASQIPYERVGSPGKYDLPPLSCFFMLVLLAPLLLLKISGIVLWPWYVVVPTSVVLSVVVPLAISFIRSRIRGY